MQLYPVYLKIELCVSFALTVPDFFSSPPECCYAVAAVKASSNFNINELKGKTSCHSCYQRPEGWNIPIGKLIATNKIQWEGPNETPVEKG